MNTNPKLHGARTLLSVAGAPAAPRRASLLILLLGAVGLALAPLPSWASLFSGNASVSISDPNGGLSIGTNANPQLTVQCWFKISIPSGVTPANNMTILVNRSSSGDTNTAHAYNLWYDVGTKTVRFSTKGTNAAQSTLIPNTNSPVFYLDRWYHFAAAVNGQSLTTYVDGQPVGPVLPVSNANRSTNGVSIGGWGSSQYLFGEVQEVSIRQAFAGNIPALMFIDQTQSNAVTGLVGYYKLGYSADPNDYYKNFAPVTNAPPGTGQGVPQPAGQIAFEPTDQKGEQSVFDSTVDGGKNAILPLSGAFTWQHTAFSRPTPGVPFEFSMAYAPGLSSTLGPGWSHTFSAGVIEGAEGKTADRLLDWQGGQIVWETTNNVAFSSWTNRDDEFRGQLTEDGQGTVFWTNSQQQIYRFFSPHSGSVLAGTLSEIRDLNGNACKVQWNGDLLFNRIVSLTDSAGGTYQLGYDADRLTNLTWGAWQVLFTYTNLSVAGKNQKLLATKTLANTSGLYTNVPTTWRFFYNTNSGLLERIVNPSGYTEVYVQYDAYGRRSKTTDALGNTTRYEYGAPGLRQIRTTDAEGYQWIDTYDRKGRVIVRRDPLGNETRYAYDEYGNRTVITDPKGNTSRLAYDQRGNMVAETNALGQVSLRTYHPFFNKPSTHTDPVGWVTTYQYDSAGNLTNVYDKAGRKLSCTYETNGLLLTMTDPLGHGSVNVYDINSCFLVAQIDAANSTKRFTRNELGWAMSSSNPLGQVTTYAYDLNGNVVLTVDPLFRVFAASYDANGNLLSRSDGKGQVTTYAYDALNHKTNEVDRTGATTRFTYTPRGKPATQINPLNEVTTFSYDAANRQTSTADALGNSTSTVFDPAGNPVATIDPLGRRWTKTFDRLNRIIAQSDSSGNTAQTVYDAAGHVLQTTSPNGSVTLNAYDGRGRLTNSVDAAGYRWRYDYDPAGNIIKITDALGGCYTMGYGARNERLTETNQDGKVWTYTYDELLRPLTQTDPKRIQRTLEYDPAGRLISVALTTGRVNTFLYDDNDNPTLLSRSGSGPPAASQFDYDPMDRLLSSRDVFNRTVAYDYDPAGRLTNMVYPGNKALSQSYDAVGRLTNQVFQLDLSHRFTNSYAFDPAGQLLSQTYPNGVVQTDTFDTAGHLTGLSYAPAAPGPPSQLNAALAYAYDRNGNTVRSQSQGLFQWGIPALYDETNTFAASGQLLTRDILITNLPQPRVTYQYDPSGNMTNATDGNQTWALTYDEDNRTMSVCWDLGTMCTKFITNRYDALGRRIARTVNGVETRYALDVAGGLERILCDVTPGGTITAWYVHGAGLSFKVAADGNLTCYHADAQGNVIALSGANGTNLIQYAYTPYGRSLGSCPGSTNYTDLDSQPFQFAGSQGVMMEERGVPGLYFMRARCYSAEAGVFLSTDPETNIGPTWRAHAYVYGNCNPLRYSDPKGKGAVGVALFAYSTADLEYMVAKDQAGPVDYLVWGLSAAALADPTDISGFAVLGIETALSIASGNGFAGAVLNLIPGPAREVVRVVLLAAFSYACPPIGVILLAEFLFEKETREKIEHAWDVTEHTLETGWNKTENAFETGWGKTEHAFDTGWNKTERAFETGWHKVEGAFETGWSKTEQAFETFGKKVESDLKSAWKKTKSFFRNLF